MNNKGLHVSTSTLDLWHLPEFKGIRIIFSRLSPQLNILCATLESYDRNICDKITLPLVYCGNKRFLRVLPPLAYPLSVALLKPRHNCHHSTDSPYSQPKTDITILRRVDVSFKLLEKSLSFGSEPRPEAQFVFRDTQLDLWEVYPPPSETDGDGIILKYNKFDFPELRMIFSCCEGEASFLVHVVFGMSPGLAIISRLICNFKFIHHVPEVLTAYIDSNDWNDLMRE